jgi:hypothetical protein
MSDKPERIKKIGRRRVRTSPAPGQKEEPVSHEGDDSTANDDRLKAEKPPHY